MFLEHIRDIVIFHGQLNYKQGFCNGSNYILGIKNNNKHKGWSDIVL